MTPPPGTRRPFSRLAAATAIAVMLLAGCTEGPDAGDDAPAASDGGGAADAAPE